MLFVVGFRNDALPPHVQDAYSCEEIDVPGQWLDDPIAWIAHREPGVDVQVVFCVPKEGYEPLLAVLRKERGS